MPRKKWPIILIFLLLSPVCLCVATTVYWFGYNRIGRVTDFRAMSDGLQIPNTNYMLRVTLLSSSDSKVPNTYEYALENLSSNNRFTLGRWSKAGDWTTAPSFAFLENNNSAYFFTKRSSGGSSGTSIYNIFNITGEKPEPISNPNGSNIVNTDFYSCTYPRLTRNELQFENAFDCDFYPILVDEQFFETVKLT